jgi:CMP-N,N'-diacetyllegionaminic acid synthase
MKTIAFDLDDVLCWHSPEYDKLGVDKYLYCEPIDSAIDMVNEYFDSGNKIVIYTARGMSICKGDVHLVYDTLYNLTYDQLLDWGVKFHRLVMGKLSYDLLIDDKVMNSHFANKERIEKYFDII